MSGFRQPEAPREQRVLWSHQLEDAIPADHPVRLFDELLRSAAFAKTFATWEREYDLRAGQPPYHPRDLAGLYLYGMLQRRRSSRQYGFAGEPPCARCPQAAGCCRDPAKGRTINRDQYEEHRERLRSRMKSPAGRATYPRRKEIVEPRFGYIKHDLGVRRFLRRGLEKVRTEWTLICTAVNIGILLSRWREVATVI